MCVDVTSMSKFPRLTPPDANRRDDAGQCAKLLRGRIAIMSRGMFASVPWTEMLILTGLLILAKA